MSDDLKGKFDEAKPIDIAASKACTQSGAFALLLSLALCVLIANWMAYPREVAAARYITYRINLANQVRQLESDPVFQGYLDSNTSAASMSIAQLLALKVVTSETANPDRVSTQSPPRALGDLGPVYSVVQPKSTSTSSTAPPKGWRPESPRLLTVVISQPLSEMPSIVNFLDKLNDPRLLIASMKESNSFDVSIVQWVNKREDLAYRNQFLHACANGPLDIQRPHPEDATYDAPLLDNDAMLKCLTLEDVQELAGFELPRFADPPTIDGGLVPDVDIRPGSLPSNLYAASVVLLILLTFVVIYFGAFAREAVESATFPASGTLFGAFSKSNLTTLVLLVAVWIPALAAISVFVVSEKLLMLIGSIPVVASVVWVYIVLQRKSYFSSLRPRLFLAKAERKPHPRSIRDKS